VKELSQSLSQRNNLGQYSKVGQFFKLAIASELKIQMKDETMC
jgi:hypothetical protein